MKMSKKEIEHLNKEYKSHFRWLVGFSIFGTILLVFGIWGYFNAEPTVVEHWYYKQPVVEDGSYGIISGLLLLCVGVYHLFFWQKTCRQIKKNVENELLEEKKTEYKKEYKRLKKEMNKKNNS